MSYEGYSEWLCAKGHRMVSDAYEDDPVRCNRCGTDLVWSHVVDQTNGVEYDENGAPYPNTVDYPLEQVGEEAEVVTIHHPIYKVPPGAIR